MTDFLTAEYPDHEADDVGDLVQHVGAAHVEESMDAMASNGEVDFDPVPTGSTGSDKVVLEFTNDSPFDMRFLYVGPDAEHDEIVTPACDECEEYTSPPTDNSCFDRGDTMRVELDPGEYRVLLTSSDTLSTPLHGDMDLKAGEEYVTCFFVTAN